MEVFLLGLEQELFLPGVLDELQSGDLLHVAVVAHDDNDGALEFLHDDVSGDALNDDGDGFQVHANDLRNDDDDVLPDDCSEVEVLCVCDGEDVLK